MSATAPQMGSTFAPRPVVAKPPTSPSIWSIAGRLSRMQYWAFAALGLVLPFVAWAMLSASGWIDPVFMPGPGAVFKRLGTWLIEDDLIADTGISVYRVLAGFALSMTMEALQAFLPVRVSSIVDVLTNTTGTALGALL